MTDRIAAYIVTLDHDIREDDAEPVLSALLQIRGVQSAKPIVSSPQLHIAEQRALAKLREKLWKVLEEGS